MDIIAFISLIFWVVLLWAWICRYFFETLLSILLSVYLYMDLLDPRVNPKGISIGKISIGISWIFNPEYPLEKLWLPDAKSWLIGKDLDALKDWRQKDKWVAENEMVRKYHQLNGHESEQTLEIVEDREAWCTVVHGVAKSCIET